jgi:MSHA pilin protein MshD
MSTNSPSRQRGLSLIELIIFMVVMGIAAAVLLQVMNLASKNSADPVRRKQALLLAEALLEEVELARFTYCDPTDPQAATATAAVVGSTGCTDNAHLEGIGQEAVTGAVGRPYDNVSDYATALGVAQSNFNDASGNIADVNGAAIDTVRLAGYTATVTLNVVPAVSPLGPTGFTITSSGTAANLNALRITVEVKYGSGSASETVTLDGYRTRYAPRSVP